MWIKCISLLRNIAILRDAPLVMVRRSPPQADDVSNHLVGLLRMTMFSLSFLSAILSS